MANTGGEISLYSHSTGRLERKLVEKHEGCVSFLDFDELNKLLVSVGEDNKIMIHRTSDGTLLREYRNNFNGKYITCMHLSVYHNLIVIGSAYCSTIYLWQY